MGFLSQTPSKKRCEESLNAVSDAIYVIGGKWKIRIIIALSEGNHRFNEIQRTVKGISARVLSNELKDLEQNGFILRKVDTGTPVVIEYYPTEYSESLESVVDALANWGLQHRKRIMELEFEEIES